MTPKQAITFLNKTKVRRGRYPGTFKCDDGVFTTNGAVLHIWKGEFSGDIEEFGAPDITKANYGKQIAQIAVTKEHLKRAIKACRAFKPRSISVHVNTRLELLTTGENGTASAILENMDTWYLGKRAKKTTVLYRHLGDKHHFNIDPKYIYDAIMGMDDVIIIEVMESGLKLHSEQAEAWVMYLN